MGGARPLDDLTDLLGLRDVHVEIVDDGGDPFGSPYRVGDAATAATGIALAAVAAFEEQRTGRPTRAAVDGRHAAAAFHGERLVRLLSQDEPELWDPIAGNYATADGWVRLHTNLTRHRDAVLGVLDVAAERTAVTAEVSRWPAARLEAAVVEAGGVAAQMRTGEEYAHHPQRESVRRRPVVDLTTHAAGTLPDRLVEPGAALDGVRVLDLTRVIAGPVAGRFLAAFGADVIRVDPPLEDALLLEIETGFGKRRTDVDLRSADDRDRFETLVAQADVLLEGFRPGALAGAGYPDARLRALAPGLVIGHLSAYGDRGPWASRRGFDSVVQVATGIAHTCGFDPRSGPGQLPAQALDHASGYLMAAGLVSGLSRRVRTGEGSEVGVSLARTAEWLTDLGRRNAQDGTETGLEAGSLPRSSLQDLLETWDDTCWGTIEVVRPVGLVGDRPASWTRPPTPRTDATATWLPPA